MMKFHTVNAVYGVLFWYFLVTWVQFTINKQIDLKWITQFTIYKQIDLKWITNIICLLLYQFSKKNAYKLPLSYSNISL